MDKVGVFNDEDTWKLKEKLRAKAKAKLGKSEPELPREPQILETAELKEPPVLESGDKKGETGPAKIPPEPVIPDLGGGSGKVEKAPPENPAAKIEKKPEVPAPEAHAREQKEEDAELKRLKQEIESTRNIYARKDYETTSVMARLTGFFGKKFFKTKSEDTADMNYYYASYKGALNNYLNYKIGELKGKNLPPEGLKQEMGDLMKYFTLDEKFSLFDARTSAKFGSEKLNKVLAWQRSHRAIWMGASVAMTLIGLGIPRRIISGFLTGVGVSGIMKNIQRGREMKKFEKTKKKNLEQFEKLEKEFPEGGDKFSVLDEYLKQEIGKLDKKLGEEKKKEIKRYITGATVGTIVGSGALSYLTKAGFHHFFPAEISTGGAGAGSETGAHESVMKGPRPMHPLDDASNKITAETPDKIPNAPIAETAPLSGKIELTIPKGSSFQGSIIKYLEEQGVEKKKAGGMAHRMYLDFLKQHPDPNTNDYFKVHPGAKLEVGMDDHGHYRVLSFQDSAPGSSKIAGASDAIEKAENAARLQKQLNIEGLPEDMKKELISGKGAEPGQNFEMAPDAKGTSGLASKPEAAVGAATGAMGGIMAAKLKEEKGKAEVISLAEKKKEKADKKRTEKAEKKEKEDAYKILSKKFYFKKRDDAPKRIIKVMKAISENNRARWEDMKDMEVKEALESESANKKIKEFEKAINAYIGPDAKYKEGETVYAWLKRNISGTVKMEKRKEAEFDMAANI